MTLDNKQTISSSKLFSDEIKNIQKKPKSEQKDDSSKDPQSKSNTPLEIQVKTNTLLETVFSKYNNLDASLQTQYKYLYDSYELSKKDLTETELTQRLFYYRMTNLNDITLSIEQKKRVNEFYIKNFGISSNAQVLSNLGFTEFGKFLYIY